MSIVASTGTFTAFVLDADIPCDALSLWGPGVDSALGGNQMGRYVWSVASLRNGALRVGNASRISHCPCRPGLCEEKTELVERWIVFTLYRRRDALF